MSMSNTTAKTATVGGEQKVSAIPEQLVARQIQQLLKQPPKGSLDDRLDAARLDELRRLFAKLYQDGDFFNNNNNDDDGGSSSETQKTWQSFLNSSHARFREQLTSRIVQGGKRTAVRTFWGVVASSPRKSKVGNLWLDSSLLLQWVQSMTKIPVWDQSIQHMVQAEFLQPFYDVQYHTMICICSLAQELYQEEQKYNNHKGGRDDEEEEDDDDNKEERAQIAERLMQMLLMIPISQRTQQELDDGKSFLFKPPSTVNPNELKVNNNSQQESAGNDDDDDSDSEESSSDDDDDDDDDDESNIYDDDVDVNESEKKPPKEANKEKKKPRFPEQSLSLHRRQWSKAWMAILRLNSLPVACLKQALQFLPQHVLPIVGRPLLFAEFFMNAYSSHNTNHASILPILALDGLFYLMIQHGLEYPNYYKQLYTIISPRLFSVKYKARFFQLLDKSVSRNTLLPAHVVAALGKRLLRCSLSAPPAGILLALAMVSNWFRKHPETACLLHRSDGTPIEDKFDATANDPAKANALHSSLWELLALQNHYYPAVTTLAASLGTIEESKVPMHNLDDYNDSSGGGGGISYKSLLEQERKRKPKRGQKSPLTFVRPESLFGNNKNDVLGSILARPTKKVKTTT